MPTTSLLNKRLADIAQSVQSSGNALALLGLGSAGLENARLDKYSDLDFFVIAKPGYKEYFLDRELCWLQQHARGAYWYRNTLDGYKFLYEDGVFCEFAIFLADELAHIPFAEGNVIWSDPAFNHAVLTPQNLRGRYQPSADTEWLLGEALTCLYSGMSRNNRGEKLSAMRLIQTHAVDRLLDLIRLNHSVKNVTEDLYAPERRFEFRYPDISHHMPRFCQGYDKNAESALAQLSWLESQYAVNPYIARTLHELVEDALNQSLE